VGAHARERHGLDQPRGGRGADGGFLLASAYVTRELRAGESMVPTRFFDDRTLLVGHPIASSALFFMAQFLPTALRYGPLGTGLLPWTATLFVVHRSTTGSSRGSANVR
jgi:hypothetical protein